jgi:hypothetical protein
MTKKSSEKQLGDELVRKNAPRFIKMVDYALSSQNLIVVMHPNTFKGEPELMYAAVYYAIGKNVMVTFHNGKGAHPLDMPIKDGETPNVTE